MLYVGYVLEKRLDVNAIIDNVVTSDLIRMCVFGSSLYHCHNWREGFVPLYFDPVPPGGVEIGGCFALVARG